MEQLTPRQIYNREYYRNNRKKICEKKRNGYSPKQKKQTATKPRPAKQIKTEVITPPKRVSPEELAKAKARQRIEDIKLARELGISVEELR